MSAMSCCPICKNQEIGQFRRIEYAENPRQNTWGYDCFKDKKLVRCPQCSFVFTYESFEEGSLSKFYSTLYKDNDIRNEKYNASTFYEYRPRNYSHVNFIRRSYDFFDGMNILEIGPNHVGMVPTFSLYCNPKYFYYEQYDFPIINHYGGKRLGNYFSKQEALKLDEEQRMDLITLSHSFEHFEPSTINESIEAMYSALKVNGCLSIEVPYEEEHEMMAPHTLFFTVENISKLLTDHGFEIVATQINKRLGTSSGVQTNNLTPKKSKYSVLKKILKPLLSFKLVRDLALWMTERYVDKKVKVLYDGWPYLRVLARKPNE